MRIQIKKKKYEIPYVKKLSKMGMLIGLMFCRREKAQALLFSIKNTKIHSLFVFLPFLAVWLDDKNRVLDMNIVKPFTLSVRSGSSYSKLLEIPLNSRYRKIINSLVGDWKSLKR